MSSSLRSAARVLDQFYTRADVAERCVEAVRRHVESRGLRPSLWLEPSAGGGVFLDLLPTPRLGLDIAPAHTAVRRANFLKWRAPRSGPVVVVGNPPFGKNSALVRQFFNRAATFAEVIGFIVPRTFQKASLQNRLDRSFWLVSEMPIEANAFIFEGQPRDVPCAFQIWERRATLRPVAATALEHRDFTFTDAESAEFAFQRVGVRAGTVHTEFSERAAASHYFIAPTAGAPDVAAALARIDWEPVRERTAGNPSISKRELIAAYVAATGRT